MAEVNFVIQSRSFAKIKIKKLKYLVKSTPNDKFPSQALTVSAEIGVTNYETSLR